jgi:threonine/homoserine/homoserine lactone efflux protein
MAGTSFADNIMLRQANRANTLQSQAISSTDVSVKHLACGALPASPIGDILTDKTRASTVAAVWHAGGRSIAVSIEFFVTSLVIVASPGTGVLYTLAAGLSRGSRASVVAAFGCTIGIVPHMAAAIMGLAALLHTSALAFQTFKYVGVAYLLYMAWNSLRETGALKVEDKVDNRSATQVTVTAILINILNPKLSIFFLAFLPQFVRADEVSPLSRMLTLSAVFMLMTFVVFVGYGLFAASVRDHVISRPRVLTWMRRTFAGAFVALGAKLAMSDR